MKAQNGRASGPLSTRLGSIRRPHRCGKDETSTLVGLLCFLNIRGNARGLGDKGHAPCIPYFPTSLTATPQTLR